MALGSPTAEALIELPRQRSSSSATKLIVGAFVLATVACVLLGAAGALRLIYPAFALLVALFLYARSKPTYVAFACWIWFLSPLVRRLADLSGGYQETSPILLAPYLVAMVSGIAMLTLFRGLARPLGMPFTFALAGILYGVGVGLTKYSILQMAPAILNWLVPIFFGFFLVEHHAEYPAIRRSLQVTFLVGTLLMGVYGVYQFFFLPSWDKLWLANVKTTTFGVAEPMQLRGFSTMNAPVIFALTMMATLLVVFGLKSKLRFIAGTCGFISLVLSFNRSAWLGFLAGTLFILAKMPTRERFRILTAFAVCLLMSPAVLVVPGVKELLTDKMQTMAQPQQDVSYQARLEGYQNAFATLASEPFGEGVGSPDIDHKTLENDDAIGPHDSLILELLYSLGWCGSGFYVIGLAIMMSRAFSHPATNSPFENSMKAVLIAFIAQCLLNDIVYGGVGFFLWAAGSVQLSAIAHSRASSRAQADAPGPIRDTMRPIVGHEEPGYSL